VDIPIAGSTRRIRLDTGVGSSLLLAEKAWAEFLPRLRIVRKTADRLLMLHGFEPCKRITVGELAVGVGWISGAVIDVVGNDNPWGDDFLLMGLGAFEKTSVALDFERSLLWVKNSNSH
jgi:hypothetical protein